MESIVLKKISLEHDSDYQIITGQVNDQELFFKVYGAKKINITAEPFISAMLFPAMQQNKKLVINDTLSVSPVFIENISLLQKILTTWYPELFIIEIAVRIEEHTQQDNVDVEAAFFSGGIDAGYTFLKHKQTIQTLIYVRGIDMQLDDDNELWEHCSKLNKEIAREYNKDLILVETNIRFFIRALGKPPIGWGIAQGSGLASIAHILGFSKTYIASSNIYLELHPYGTHPLTDPLFSSKRVKIVHDGCEARRHQKMLEIAKHDFIFSRLRVCWQDKGFNCGHCDKCLHFRMALTLIDYKRDDLECLLDFKELSGAHTANLGEYIEWQDNLILAKLMGKEKAAKALNKLLFKYRIKQIVALLDEHFFSGSALKRWRDYRKKIKSI